MDAKRLIELTIDMASIGRDKTRIEISTNNIRGFYMEQRHLLALHWSFLVKSRNEVLNLIGRCGRAGPFPSLGQKYFIT